MKKFVSLFLVMCVLVVNCMVPFAAEEIITEDEVVFYDSQGNTIKQVELKCGEEFYYTYNYYGNGSLIWINSGDNVISFDSQKQCITARSEGEADIIAFSSKYTELGRLTVVVTEADTKTDEKDENGESETGTDDGKGDTDEGDDGKGDSTEEGDTTTVSGKVIFTDENGGEISELYLQPNVTYSLSYTTENVEEVYFETENSNVAYFSEKDGCIYTYSSGTAVIVAYDSNKTEIGRLTVYVSEDGTAEDGKGDDGKGDDGKGDGKEDSDMPTEISFEEISATVYVGESHTFYYSLSPENANSDKLVWSTENTDIISLNKNVVTGKAVGEATVNIYNTNGDYLGTCYITVKYRMTGICLDKTELTLKYGDCETIYATILPEGAECDGLNWNSSDTSVVSLNYTGEFKSREIYANGVGKATITVSDDKGGFSASCEVTVEQLLVKSITLDQTSMEMTVGDTEYISKTIEPYNANDKSVTWSSSNEAVATVSEWGYVEAVGVGEAVITAEANDGSGAKATCNVTVKKSISLNYSSMTLYLGDSRKNYAYVNPSNEDGKDVEWSSSDSSVATVDEDGNVMAISEGKAVITATAINGGGAFATCTVTVRDGAVKGIALDKTTLEINIGEYNNLEATFTPAYAINKKVTWKSSDENVVSANWSSWNSSSCELYGIKEGTATITATSEDGGYTATCTVTVKKIPVTGITLDKETLDLRWHHDYYLSETISPSNASYKNVTWKSSNENVATVNSYGGVYAVGEGTATITATTEDGGYTATCTVKVTKTPVTGISLNKTEMEIEIGSNEELIATILPEDADDKTIDWTSSDSSIARVNPAGFVYGDKVGTATITATTEDGNYTATCTVKVTPIKVEGITIPQQNIEVQPERGVELTVYFTPENATNKNIIWSSDNEDVAYAYTSYGYHIVYGKALGTTTITATTEDGGYMASFTVKVVPISVTGVSVDPHLSTMGGIGEGSKLWATVYPYNATNQNVIWSSENEDIAEVIDDSYGNKRIYAKKAGTTRIWATTEDGGYQDSCLVEVLFDMKDDDITLLKSGDSYTVTCDYNTSCLRDLKWSSSDTSVATVDENGVVTAVGKGTATIKLSGEYCGEGYGEESFAACNVTVIGTSGTLIDNVTWKLEDDGTTLTIGGSGDIPEYSYDEYEYDAYKDNITKIVIGSGITCISGEPFNNFKKLEKVVISDTVTSVNFNAFSNCPGFEWEIDEENTSLCVKDGVLFSYDMKTLYSYPISKTDEKYVVPSSVEVIFGYAFGSGENYKNTSLKRIVLDKNLTSIGDYAFNNCNIERIYYCGSYSEWYNVSKYYYPGISDDCKIMTDYVTTLYEDGYEYYIKDGVACIFDYILPITEQSFTVAGTLGGYPVKAIGEYIFESECITDEYGESYYNVIDELIIPEGVEKLDACAFENFYADKVVIPSTVTKIGIYALNGIGAEISVSAENANYISVDGVLFSKDKTVLIKYPSEKSGKEYTTPSEVKTIEEGAFSGCLALEKVILGNNVEEIGYYAFQYCTKLKSITIPASVTAIGHCAFYNSNNLTDVYYGGTEKRWNSIEIGDWRNEALGNATKHYGTVEVDPVYIKEGRSDWNNNCFYYNVYLNGIDVGKTVAFAFYNDGMLINCDYKTYTGEEYLEFKRDYDWGMYDCIKAMVWDSMENMTPVCKYAVKYFQLESSTVD